MITQLLDVNEQSLKLGASLIKQGELVAFPTETVYGLGADALNGEAVRKIFRAKGRPGDNPLIVHVSSKEGMKELGYWNQSAEDVFNAFMPGPITMVLKKKSLPDEVTAGLDTVGLRYPQHKDAQSFLKLAGAVAAPSANISGKPSPTTAQHVFNDFNGRIPLVLNGGECGVGVESTVISLVDRPMLLRPGGVTLEQLQTVLPDITVHQAVLKNVELDKAASPGMKYKHYAPNAVVILVDGNGEWLYNNACDCGIKTAYYKKSDAALEAKLLFSRLRDADQNQLDLVIFELPANSGMGLSVANRMLRAAAFTVLKQGQSMEIDVKGRKYTLKA